MRWIRVGTTDLLECERCDATWIEAAVFERLCAKRENQAAFLETSAVSEKPPVAPVQPVRYRRCPRCGKMMNRVNFGRLSGAIVDVCRGHGTFLDRGELHQIVRFIQQGGLERAREAQRQELADERWRQQMLDRAPASLEVPAASGQWNQHWLRELFAALFDR